MARIKCWHFLQDNRRLRWGTQEVVEEGKTYIAKGEPVLCENGMHGSEDIFDALKYAPGSVICLVEIWGKVKRIDDKLVGQNRKVLKMIDGDDLLHKFARKCALHAVKKYWHNAPDIVVKYLKTGKEKYRAAARVAVWDAAGAAARDAARVAAWDAAWAAAWDAAWAAARAAAGDAAWAAAWDAARGAARDAAGDATRAAQKRMLHILIKKEMGIFPGAGKEEA